MAFGIPNLERELSLFLEGKSGITAIRNVEYDRAYLWAIDFLDFAPPEPFDTFFPASAVTFGLTNLNTKEIVYGQDAFEFPKNKSPKEISVTFYDNQDHVLEKYFQDWIDKDICNDGFFMSGLTDSHQLIGADSFGNNRRVYPSRAMRLIRLDSYRTENSIRKYLVFPKGNIDFSGSNDSAATEYTITFSIVEDLASKLNNQSIGGFSFDTVRQSLGRFL